MSLHLGQTTALNRGGLSFWPLSWVTRCKMEFPCQLANVSVLQKSIYFSATIYGRGGGGCNRPNSHLIPRLIFILILPVCLSFFLLGPRASSASSSCCQVDNSDRCWGPLWTAEEEGAANQPPGKLEGRLCSTNHRSDGVSHGHTRAVLWRHFLFSSSLFFPCILVFIYKYIYYIYIILFLKSSFFRTMELTTISSEPTSWGPMFSIYLFWF